MRAITIRLATNKPSRLLRTLLEQAWTDVLALTVLRQGEKSDTYRKQLAVADQLIAVGGAMQTMLDNPLAATWREEIETGLEPGRLPRRRDTGGRQSPVRAGAGRTTTTARSRRPISPSA